MRLVGLLAYASTIILGASVLAALPLWAEELRQENSATKETVVQAKDVSIDGPAGMIKGTYMASGVADAPLVVILPGSGPTDRDGNNPLGILAAPYRLLAEELAQQGVDTIRFDKRGIADSAAAIADPNAVRIADYGNDALAFARQDIAESGRSCVWLAGHSEGGVIGLSVIDDDIICGLVLIAAPGRAVGDILRSQLAANPANAPILEQANAAIDKLEAGEEVDDSALHPSLQPLFNLSIQPFLRDFMRYDPVAMIAQSEKPILLVYGDKDIQTPISEGVLLKNANQAAILQVFAKMNHVLKTVKGDTRQANLQTYADPNLPLAHGVDKVIANFVKARR